MKILNSLFEVFPNTMSVHLREKQAPLAKHGTPGMWKLEKINKEIITNEKILDMIDMINEFTSLNESDIFIEDTDEYFQVIQLKNFRIVITYPPFSNIHEITIVRPTLEKKLSDYNLPDPLLHRLRERAEGILIAGAPGHGKSTFTFF